MCGSIAIRPSAREGSMASRAEMPLGCMSSAAPRGRRVARSNTATRRSGLRAAKCGEMKGVVDEQPFSQSLEEFLFISREE